MIEKHLDENIELIDKLIKLTEEDIGFIQQGRHDTVAKSVKEKNKLIALFQNAKKELDDALVRLSDNGSKNLAEILDENDKSKLAEFKKKLEYSHEKNKEYAKLVLVVKNFFDELLNTMFDDGSGTNNAYGDKKTNLDSLFKINV